MPTKNHQRFKALKIYIIFLTVLDFLVWLIILFSQHNGVLGLYFLSVGQGDSSLAVTPSGAKILFDGGPVSGGLENQLSNILPFSDRYIDVVVISHPQIDHFGGLVSLLKNYDIGAVVVSDGSAISPEWKEFEKEIQEKKIPQIVLAAGSKISSKDFSINVLAPAASAVSGSENDLSLVAMLTSSGVKTLFTGDIGADEENLLAKKGMVDADILKVAHHGSKYSSSSNFLEAVTPIFSLIEVGKNSYGHPTPEALSRLQKIGSQIFRTDKNGLIKIEVINGKMSIFANSEIKL